MKQRLLLIDIGNTSIKLGLCENVGLIENYSLATHSSQTADSFGLLLMQLLQYRGLTRKDIDHCVVSSVVPEVEPMVRQACERFLELKAVFCPGELPVGLENKYAQPTEVGADRLLGAFAARRLYPEAGSIISVDFGTATTFDCVAENAYLGGLICPGVLSSQQALASKTAKLGRIHLEVAENVPLIGSSTTTSMSHGFVFGFAAMTEGLCLRLKAQLPGPTVVIGTGGFAPDVARVSTCMDALHPNLILEGLRLAWNEFGLSIVCV